jgi:hypothetical protein
LSVSDIETDCDPIVRNEDIGANLKNLKGETLDPKGVAWPCGLVAKSLFTDKYELYDPSGKNITINDIGIAWDSDKEYKFKNGDGDYKAKQWHDVTDGTYSLLINYLCRAFHRVDENSRSAQFQKAVGQN